MSPPSTAQHQTGPQGAGQASAGANPGLLPPGLQRDQCPGLAVLGLLCTSRGSGVAPGSGAKCSAALGGFVPGRGHPSSQPRAFQGWITGPDGALGTPVDGHRCRSLLESRTPRLRCPMGPCGSEHRPGRHPGRGRRDAAGQAWEGAGSHAGSSRRLENADPRRGRAAANLAPRTRAGIFRGNGSALGVGAVRLDPAPSPCHAAGISHTKDLCGCRMPQGLCLPGPCRR